MTDYKNLTEEESKQVHNTLLRDPDKNYSLFAKKLLGSNDSISLPLSFELLLMDKSPSQILQELLDYYCKTAVLQFDLKKSQDLKRKSTEAPSTSKKVKQ